MQARGGALSTEVTLSSEIFGGLSVARGIIGEGGFAALWRGCTVQAASCGPAHALMFAAYEQTMHYGGALSTGTSKERTAVVGAAAGAVSTVLHDAVMVPADVIKQRLQLGYYRNAWHCLERMLASGGGSTVWLWTQPNSP